MIMNLAEVSKIQEPVIEPVIEPIGVRLDYPRFRRCLAQ